MEEILGIFTPSEPKIIQDVTSKEMILELQEKVNILISSPFVSEFATQWRQNDIPRLKAKKCMIRCQQRGLFFTSPLPNAPQQKFDLNLRKRFKYSNWRDRVGCIVCTLLPPNPQ